ncbi:hypothetical protein LCGC14_2159970 [marine sediment metagenome]|uniref:Uncharacterized protein n=1 Tax=marine sediment metagenome TaxID=412755 RepID=A0A0F9G5Z1_9ZZZZ
MKDSWIHERFPTYYIFGESENSVDVASIHNSTVATVSKEHAENLIRDRDAVINMLIDLVHKLVKVAPDQFGRLWYNNPKKP